VVGYAALNLEAKRCPEEVCGEVCSDLGPDCGRWAQVSNEIDKCCAVVAAARVISDTRLVNVESGFVWAEGKGRVTYVVVVVADDGEAGCVEQSLQSFLASGWDES
jgi:hypothetical protein